MTQRTKFGIYGGQFIHKILRMVPCELTTNLNHTIAKNKIS